MTNDLGKSWFESQLIYKPTPNPDNNMLTTWLQAFRDAETSLTSIGIDEISNYQSTYLSEIPEKEQEKEHKPKQQMPYWANNWRKK